MDTINAEIPRRKGIRKLLHRWKEKVQNEKTSKPPRVSDPKKRTSTVQKPPQQAKPAKPAKPAKKPRSNPRRNTAPADLLSSASQSHSFFSRRSIASPTPSAPAPANHQNRRATTGYFTASDVRNQIAADEARLVKRAADIEYHHERETTRLFSFDHQDDRAAGEADISPSGTGPVKQWPWGK